MQFSGRFIAISVLLKNQFEIEKKKSFQATKITKKNQD